MKRALALLASLFSLSLAAAPAAVVKAQSAVYNLWRFEEGALRVICSGTVIQSKQGPRFLSAGHCVEDATAARYYISQATDPSFLVRVTLEDWYDTWPTSDYSLFSLPKGFHSPALPLCAGQAAIGEDVWSWTGPLGIVPVLRTGMYSGPLHFPDDSEAENEVGGMFFVQTNGDGGSSGSSLLRLENGSVCVWAIWVGGWTTHVKLDGALGVPIPPRPDNPPAHLRVGRSYPSCTPP